MRWNLNIFGNTVYRLKKGLVQVLERLRKSGLRMAVATSSRRAIAEEYLINANVYKFLM